MPKLKPKNNILVLLFLMLALELLSSCGVKKALADRPNLDGYDQQILTRKKINDSTFIVGKNFLTRNKQGLWEIYLEGDAWQRGQAMGELEQDLIEKQEAVFFGKLNELVPSKTWQNFLVKFLAYYNRKIPQYIPKEYKAEIYGVSKYMSADFNNIAQPYVRALYLHSAHDIGHALQDLALVGCSSFAVWDEKSEDGGLLIGRNFDFYVNDAFAEDKVIAFVNPKNGYKFMSYTWPGFSGVVSGMNNQGLTVTINASKSKIPTVAKTPISIVAREILQYASNIEEAIAIAKKCEVFVSESIFIGSAKDKKAAIIEVSPGNFGVYDVPNSADQLVCTNHFQSEAYEKDKRNAKQIEESHSEYRFERLQELISENESLNPKKAVAILRNKKGLDEKEIGYGNEKALNQLLAHHGIVFQPEKLKVWVSANPFQLGEFVCYDLNEVFSGKDFTSEKISLSEENSNIAEDPIVHSEDFRNYQQYRKLEAEVIQKISEKQNIESEKFSRLIKLNPEFWNAYYLQGVYYYNKGFDAAAKRAFEKAMTKEITTVPDLENVERYLRKL